AGDRARLGDGRRGREAGAAGEKAARANAGRGTSPRPDVTSRSGRQAAGEDLVVRGVELRERGGGEVVHAGLVETRGADVLGQELVAHLVELVEGAAQGRTTGLLARLLVEVFPFEEGLVHVVVALRSADHQLGERLGDRGLAFEDVGRRGNEAGVVVADEGGGRRVAEDEAVLVVEGTGSGRPEEHRLLVRGAGQLQRITYTLLREGRHFLVERPLGRIPGIVLAVLFRLAGALLRRAFETLLRLVDVTDDGREDRLRKRRADLAGAGDVTLRKIRHAAGIVGRARGVAAVSAVEVLARCGRDRPPHSSREQDAPDRQSPNALHAVR